MTWYFRGIKALKDDKTVSQVVLAAEQSHLQEVVDYISRESPSVKSHQVIVSSAFRVAL